MAQLLEVERLSCKENIDTETFVEITKKVLKAGGVEETIAVDSEGKVIGNKVLCNVLIRLGVKKIPVSLMNPEKVFYSLEELGFYDEVLGTPFRVFENSEELLYKGWPTPLVRLRSLENGSIRVWGKLEGFNPWGMSVKDRVGWMMFKNAIEELKKPPKLVVEATSTNTGLAVAAMCAIYGSKLKVYIPNTVSKTGEILLKIFGADVVRSDKPLTTDLIDEVEAEAKRLGAVSLNQFYNDVNLETHLRFTAKELDLQVRKAGLNVKAVIGGLGTSGHMSAISIYFKSRLKDIKTYGVVPKKGSTIQGIRRVESGMKWLKYTELDGVVEVDAREAAEEVVFLTRREGIFLGLSSGAVLSAYKKLIEGREIREGDVILVLPDMGFKYVDLISELLGL
ncbi:MAG: pyridoxal-phosphate dependent enzyme [Acidilobaceae archaeon]